MHAAYFFSVVRKNKCKNGKLQLFHILCHDFLQVGDAYRLCQVSVHAAFKTLCLVRGNYSAIGA